MLWQKAGVGGVLWPFLYLFQCFHLMVYQCSHCCLDGNGNKEELFSPWRVQAHVSQSWSTGMICRNADIMAPPRKWSLRWPPLFARSQPFLFLTGSGSGNPTLEWPPGPATLGPKSLTEVLFGNWRWGSNRTGEGRGRMKWLLEESQPQILLQPHPYASVHDLLFPKQNIIKGGALCVFSYEFDFDDECWSSDKAWISVV